MELPNLKWFEEVCVELNRQPMAATATLTAFREQEFALEAVNSYLSDPSCTPLAQFQACLILQHNSLKNWPRLSGTQKLQLRETLYSLMNNAIATSSMPPYALNKVMQVYALFWKRDWKDLTTGRERDLQKANDIFEYIRRMLQSTPEAFKHGCILLRVLVEEFSSRSSAEAGLPVEFHRQAHEIFENAGGLDQSLQLAMQCLSAAFQMTDPSIAVPCTVESAKLFNEVISWDFGATNLSHSSNAFLRNKLPSNAQSQTSQLHTLPRRWSPILLHPSLVESVYNSYTRTRQLLEISIRDSAPQSSVDSILLSLSELRAALINLASVSGQILENDTERKAHGGAIMAKTLPLLDAAISLNLDAQCAGDFRAQECENLGTVLLRLLINFRLSLCCQMESFDAMMNSLGRATFDLSKELATQAELQLNKIYIPNGNLQGWQLDSLDGDFGLLDGWRGDAISLFLDVWCMVLDDPLMLRTVLTEDGTNSAVAVSSQLKMNLREVAAEVFKQLYESVWRITICEALAVPEEEEGEDAAAIAVRNMDDLLSSICTVGRTNFHLALGHVNQSIVLALDETERLAALPAHLLSPRDTLRLLESLRVAVLFASHLCDDGFRGDPQEKSSDTPLIPAFILDSGLYASAETSAVLVQSLAQMSRLLHLQVQLGSAHPLFSPLLLQVVARFFSEYFARFVDADPELYSDSTAKLLPHLFSLHSSGVNGESGGISALLEQLAAAVSHLIVAAPLESDLVTALAELLTAMSKGGSSEGAAKRRSLLLASPSVAQIYKTVTAHDCRLSLDGIMLLYCSLGSLAARAGSEPTILQLCSYVHTKGSSLSYAVSKDSGGPGFELKMNVQQYVACLRGLATIPRGQDRVIYGLFDASLPVLAWALTHGGLGGEDDVTKAILLLLRDFAEHKLAGLPHQSSLALYQTAMTALQTFSLRLKAAPVAAAGTAAAEEEISFRSDILLHILELLNHLSSKDFSFDDDEEVAIQGLDCERGFSFHVTVAEVLLFGFEMVAQLVTPDVLRNYPATCERYLSFAAFLSSTYGEDLGSKLQKQDEAQARVLLSTLMQHLLWGAGAIDASAARLALQAIQSLAAFQASSMARGDPGLGLTLSAEIFPAALERLLEMVLFPASCEYGIAWDRVDACANALINLVVLDNQR